MKSLMIKDLSMTEELARKAMSAVRGGILYITRPDSSADFCGTPVPSPFGPLQFPAGFPFEVSPQGGPAIDVPAIDPRLQ
jgi:hypothetical protein